MATLVYSDVDGIDRSFALGTDPITVGRAAECAIRSDDPRVSRLHARFFIEQGKLWVEDLGSSNGIYVGPNKVQKSQVPTGEIILIGSLMIRLLPPSGTLPPPVGIHGTLAQWLDMERKARAAVEEERDAFAQRVNEIHQQLAAAAQVPVKDPELEREVIALRQQASEIGRVRGQLDEAKAARATADAARQAIEHEQMSLRAEIDELRRAKVAELEQLRLDIARANEAKVVAEAQGGLATASKLAEADLMIASLQNELGTAKKVAAAANADPRVADLTAQLVTATGRLEKADKELQAAQIRAQGAERNLGGANATAAKSDARAALLDQAVKEATARATAAELALAEARHMADKLAATTLPSMPAAVVDDRADKLAAELADVKAQFDTRRDRIVELEAAVAEAQRELDAAKHGADTARRDADAARAELKQKLDAVRAEAKKPTSPPPMVSADQAVMAMREERDAAIAKQAELDRRAEDAEKRASAADTMAKAMAKDVAEALRRAVESDSRAKSVGRELADAFKRADAAEQRATDKLAAFAELEKRATDSEAKLDEAQSAQRESQQRIEAAQHDTAAQLEAAEREAQEQIDEARREAAAASEIARNELGAKIEQIQREAAIRLEQAQREATAELEELEETSAARVAQLERELAAERSSAMTFVDRRGVMERELSELRTAIGPMEARADLAERRAAELDVQLEMLQERVLDLESALEVEKTASQTSVDEARAKVTAIEERAATLDGELRRANEARGELEDACAQAEAALEEAHEAADAAIAEARGAFDAATAEAHAASVAELAQLKAALEEAEAHARDCESQIEPLFAKAEQADLALGRAAGLQRQLDEALAKLAWQERDAGNKVRAATEADAMASERATTAEARTRELDAKLRDLDAKLREAESRAQGVAGADGRLRDAMARIAELENEVEAADNVRQFAAATEREIAQLQRDLREARKQLADRPEPDDTTGVRQPITTFDPEITAQADVGKYEEMIKKSAELEQRAQRMEREEADLRKRLNETEAKLRAALEMIPEDDAMRTSTSMPGAVAEHLVVLEESIDSLRSNMRAASDETAVMEQTESVVAVAGAVSNAAEHIERAKEALKALMSFFDR